MKTEGWMDLVAWSAKKTVSEVVLLIILIDFRSAVGIKNIRYTIKICQNIEW